MPRRDLRQNEHHREGDGYSYSLPYNQRRRLPARAVKDYEANPGERSQADQQRQIDMKTLQNSTLFLHILSAMLFL
jgi:hypothetical protein